MPSSPNRHEALAEDEDDSLFGSPPPSPGRSPSPALALPGNTSNASGNIVSSLTKNVGTIALPGSQANSEYLNPVASSLSLPSSSTQPPLPSSRFPGDSHAASTTPSTCAVPQPAPPKPPRVRKRKKKSTEEVSRPEFQIALPDPAAPPPSNFLRSQTALLGAAGLVAGINPAYLDHRPRGTTPSNPIVIEEAAAHKPPPPRPKKTTPTIPSISTTPAARNVAIVEPVGECLDKPGLSMPSKQEILAYLVKEKDVFPIIQCLIKITAPGATHPPTRKRSSSWGKEELAKRGPRTEIVGTHATGFPMKKRKLNRVPAGAADWDIPFPFARGEGPEEYDETWRSEREKQLITQLINLIKNATKKAAMHNYLKRKSHRDSKSKGKAKEEHAVVRHPTCDDGPRVNKYYKAITATYGLPPSNASSRQSTPSQDRDSSRNQSRSVTPSTVSGPSSSSAATTPAPEQAQGSSSLDQLLASLFSMTAPRQDSAQPLQPASTSKGGEPVDQLSSIGVDQNWLDDWMNSLSTPGGMGIDGAINQPAAGSSTGASTPSLDFDFSSLDFESLGAPSTSANTPSFHPTQIQSSTDPLCAPTVDFPIDPDLLALSGPNFDASLPVPPIPTTLPSDPSSSATNPASTEDWDMSMMGIFAPEFAGDMFSSNDGQFPSLDHGQGGDSLWDEFLGQDLTSKAMDVDPVPQEASSTEVQPTVPSSETQPDALPSADASAPETPADDPPAPPPSVDLEVSKVPSNSGTENIRAAPSKTTLSEQKEDLIRRVRERKAMLEAELKKVKLQLWEATVEQGALHHVVGQLQEKEKNGVLMPIDNNSLS
ncbi:hypothetical protein D9611_001853 [Ephemerocybe angulata]|uniref:Uncharacterized protein n=1 Tax=Ephemerocybe angulata TaxID=980116 RepID=A0A8H5CKJ7_9AGAR|nr:hypothetical protein D9611_001853 [Tulosesus angulatus]